MINNRQNGNGRRRGRSGNAPRPGGGGQPDRGSRLDNRARGNASQLHEKYKTLAADAQRQGDRVMTEYYLQFADHYFRVLSENRPRFEEQPRRDRFDAAGEDYDDAENDAEGVDERPVQREQDRGEGERDGYRDRGRQDRGDGNRAAGARGEGRRDDVRHDEGRSDGNRAGGNRYDGDRGMTSRGQGVPGLEGPRADAGQERPMRGEDRQPRAPRGPREGFDRPRRDRGEEQLDETPPVAAGPAPVEPVPAPVPAVEASAPAAELPLDAPVVERRPRGRPRKVAAPVEPVVEASGSERIDLDRLPPAIADNATEAATAEAKPRRTRRPRGEAAAV